MDKSVTSKCKNLIVAAIDFGTTYSGYAFSFKDNWTKVLTNKWQGGGLLSHKAPTVLLLRNDKSFVAFGYDAEDKYSELTAKNEHESYFFFQRFKMILHKDVGVKRSIECPDVRDKKMEASKVFTHCIKHLKDHLLDAIKKSVLQINEGDIEYVLTVPAIWGDKAKMFMREAAIQAGIDKNRLIIALEPEAASIYCQNFHFEKQEAESILGEVKSGTKYMVLDLGGGTADITVHEKDNDGTLEEILPASGGPWGGKSVDDAFLKHMTDLCGDEVMKEFKNSYMEDYIELFRTFEAKKRTFKADAKPDGFTTMTIPQAFFNLCLKRHNVDKFPEVINKKPTLKDNMKHVSGKLKWKNGFFNGFFRKTIDSIVKHTEELLNEEVARKVDIILMVGGFSECDLVQKAIKDYFPDKRVIVPQEAGLAVVKGAVFFGHIPGAISRRSARYTYGIQTWPAFSEDVHPPERKTVLDGRPRCRNVFFKYISKGEKITPGFCKSQIFQALANKMGELECAIYISEEKNPRYVDEPGCRRLGVLRIPLPTLPTQQNNSEIEETMIFGETELRFQARDISTNTHREVIFDLLRDEEVE